MANFFHHVCNEVCKTLGQDGFFVCRETGRVLEQIITNRFENAQDAALSSLNTKIPGQNSSVQAGFFDNGEKDFARQTQNLYVVLDATRSALGTQKTSKNQEWVYTPGVSLIRAFSQFCFNNEKKRKREESEETIRTEDIARRILTYYMWCIKRSKQDRVPKIRMFTIAMLCVMRDGLESNDVYLIPRCAFCAERLSETKKIPDDVLQAKPRSLTTAIKFIKATIGDAVRTEGGVYRILSQFTSLGNI